MKREKMKQVKRSVRGQSTLEYILVIAAVLIALVAVMLNVLRPAVQHMTNESAATITDAADKVKVGVGL